MGFYTGVFNTTDNPTELNMRSFASHLLRLFPNGSAPLFAMTSQTGRSRAKSSTHGYFSKTMAFASVVTNGATPSTTAAITVLSNVGIQIGMVLHNPATMENMRVTAVNANTTEITVTRAYGRIAAATIATATTLVVIGNSQEEGSARPTARGLTMVYIPNYTQIFRNAWAVTDTARASYTEAGFGNLAESRKDCSLFHSADIEAAILWGQAEMDTTGTQPLHATQGVIDAVEQYAAANTNAAATTTSFSQWVTLVEPAFTYSADIGDPKSRTLFGGATAIKVINDIARKNGTVQILDGQTNFGLNFTKFTFYKGTIFMIEHPLMNGIAGMAGLAVLMDMPALKLAYMDGRDTMPEEYGGTGRNNANGVDAQGGSLTTECAVELINPAGCAVIYNLQAGVADS